VIRTAALIVAVLLAVLVEAAVRLLLDVLPRGADRISAPIRSARDRSERHGERKPRDDERPRHLDLPAPCASGRHAKHS